MMANGEIQAFKIGTRRLISAEYLREWLQARQEGR
jgi:excisionase family DNA binding protein